MAVSTISQAGLNAPLTLTSPTLTTPNIDSAQIPTVSGTAPLYMCRAWVNFNGTGTPAIRASGNVTSITDNGVGDYTVNFTTAMTDANYSMPSSSANTGPTMSIASPQLAATPFTTTTARIETRNTTSGGLLDCQFVCLGFFR
jgi:hypothetical protein